MLHYVTQVNYNLGGSAHNLVIPRPLTEAGKRSLRYQGATLWNGLPTSLSLGQGARVEGKISRVNIEGKYGG